MGTPLQGERRERAPLEEPETHKLAESKRTPTLTERILSLRRARNLSLRRARDLGAKRLQAELIRLDATSLSTSTIYRVLADTKVKPIKRSKRPKQPKRYNRPTAGDRVQVNSMKVAQGLVQFTAVYDCTRLRVLGLYPDKTGVSAAHFFEERVLTEFPFPIERVQTDRGSEFVSQEFIGALRKHRVKLRPNRARAPHLNGKVERSQQTDRIEFYALEIDGTGRHRKAREPDQMSTRLAEWQRFYNVDRPHSGLGGRTPQQRWEAVKALTSTREELDRRYDPASEPTSVRRGNWVWVASGK